MVGGLGASLLLPAMQSLIHGNFEGAAQKKAYALVGASAAIAAAVGPLLGGFVTTYLSWRVGFLFEVAVIAVVLSGIRLVHDVPYTGSRRIDLVGALLSVLAMGGIVLGILLWQEGGESVLAVLAIGAAAMVLRLYGRGIRRRLAPMLGGDQRRIRLAYSLSVHPARHAGHPLRRGDRHGRRPVAAGPGTRSVRRCSGHTLPNAGFSARRARPAGPPGGPPTATFGYEHGQREGAAQRATTRC